MTNLGNCFDYLLILPKGRLNLQNTLIIFNQRQVNQVRGSIAPLTLDKTQTTDST